VVSSGGLPGGRAGERPTLRGLARVLIPIRGRVDYTPCVVFGAMFPAWLGVVRQAGFRPVLVVLGKADWLDVVQSVVEPDCVVCIGNIDGQTLPAWAELVGFVDGWVTSAIIGTVETLGFTSLLSTKSPQRGLPGWKSLTQAFLHEASGGVTTAMQSLTRFGWGSPDLVSQAVPTEILRDASMVLSTRRFVGAWVAAPATCTLTPLCCLNLGSVDAPIYYSGGLLPGTVDKRTAVAVPSNFAPAGFWGQPRLTAKEILFAKDVSEDLANISVAKGLSETFLAAFPPLGTLRVDIGSLLASRESNGGGRETSLVGLGAGD
jgi:hypothetical protein